MRISGFDDPDSSGWDALHRGTEREGFDSPSKFDMSTLSMIMPKRKPARPQPDPQGYTDEDTREWGPSSDFDEGYDGSYDPVEPEWQDEGRYAAEPPPLEPAGAPPRGRRQTPPPGARPPRPPPGTRPGRARRHPRHPGRRRRDPRCPDPRRRPRLRGPRRS